MLHNMLFFWHRYELPAVCLGQVTPQQPRQDLFASAPPLEEDISSATPRQQPPRSLSFNTTASNSVDRISRNSSSAGLFHRDDDDASAFYGVNGEVIVHHNMRAPSPLDRLLTPIMDHAEGSSLQAILRPGDTVPTTTSLET